MRGASAQGLALDAGGSNAEIPAFTEFWIRKPDRADNNLVVHALLEGPGVTGAYTFVIAPGAETVVDARATLFFRQPGANAGFAPVSGMFRRGETAAQEEDFQPEVHNVDGLLVAPQAGARLWRPLTNPAGVTVSDYDSPQLAGFGLLQRDRKFRSYEDLKAHYERSPGVWIEPVGPWPPGRVRLVETPSTDLRRPNIMVCWLPRDPFPGRPAGRAGVEAALDLLAGVRRTTRLGERHASGHREGQSRAHQVRDRLRRRFHRRPAPGGDADGRRSRVARRPDRAIPDVAQHG